MPWESAQPATDVSDRNLVNITPLQLSEEVFEVHNDMPGWRTLLNIVDLHDGAFRLRVLWILYHRHVQFVLIFVEGDVGRTSARAETCTGLGAIPLPHSFDANEATRLRSEPDLR